MVERQRAGPLVSAPLTLTWRGDEHFGSAAGETVQERLRSDVEVEESNRTAQLGQAEPCPDEAGLVGQKQGDRVPLLQLGFSLQSSGHLVALFIHLAISELLTFKVQEDLVGMSLHCIQEAVQDAVKRFDLLIFDEPDAKFNAPQNIGAIVLKIWGI